ncbi:MAG: hypothetical protein ABJK20_04395 [Halieaceae bacterium]
MQAEQESQSRVQRAVSDLVLAELFLVQATIESVAAIGDGISAITGNSGESANDADDLSSVLQRTADEAIEPYTTRFKYFRQLTRKDS